MHLRYVRVVFALFAFVRVIRVCARLSLTRTKNAMGSTYKRDNRVFCKKVAITMPPVRQTRWANTYVLAHDKKHINVVFWWVELR